MTTLAEQYPDIDFGEIRARRQQATKVTDFVLGMSTAVVDMFGTDGVDVHANDSGWFRVQPSGVHSRTQQETLGGLRSQDLLRFRVPGTSQVASIHVDEALWDGDPYDSGYAFAEARR